LLSLRSRREEFDIMQGPRNYVTPSPPVVSLYLVDCQIQVTTNTFVRFSMGEDAAVDNIGLVS
jgi:hypothetical protein